TSCSPRVCRRQNPAGPTRRDRNGRSASKLEYSLLPGRRPCPKAGRGAWPSRIGFPRSFTIVSHPWTTGALPYAFWRGGEMKKAAQKFKGVYAFVLRPTKDDGGSTGDASLRGHIDLKSATR